MPESHTVLQKQRQSLASQTSAADGKDLDILKARFTYKPAPSASRRETISRTRTYPTRLEQLRSFNPQHRTVSYKDPSSSPEIRLKEPTYDPIRHVAPSSMTELSPDLVDSGSSNAKIDERITATIDTVSPVPAFNAATLSHRPDSGTSEVSRSFFSSCFHSRISISPSPPGILPDSVLTHIASRRVRFREPLVLPGLSLAASLTSAKPVTRDQRKRTTTRSHQIGRAVSEVEPNRGYTEDVIQAAGILLSFRGSPLEIFAQ